MEREPSPVWAPTPDGFEEAVAYPPPDGDHDGRVRSVDGRWLDVGVDECCPRGVLPEGGYDDNTQLAHLDEANMLHNLSVRYENGQIYTYVGTILVAINPYADLPLYGEAKMREYRGRPMRSLPPHPYAIADFALRLLSRDHEDQSIVVSGESGAGKTETCKTILRYLAFRSTAGGEPRADGRAAPARSLERQVLATNPALEAFGNACTVRNGNSSRFGKLVRTLLDAKTCEIGGAKIDTYLLERSRVSSVPRGERSFHVFYQLCAGLPAERAAELGLEGGSVAFRTLTAGGLLSIPGVDDGAEFEAVRGAFETMGVHADALDGAWALLAAVLHLGNVEFREMEGCYGRVQAVRAPSAAAGAPAGEGEGGEEATENDARSAVALAHAARLLGVSEEELEAALTTRAARSLAGREAACTVHLDLQAAAAARDGLCKGLYTALFGAVVGALNARLGALGAPEANELLSPPPGHRAASTPLSPGSGPGSALRRQQLLLRPELHDVAYEPNYSHASPKPRTPTVAKWALPASTGRAGAPAAAPLRAVSLLDIFGFECFEQNGLEQLFINYANERLQRFFLARVLDDELALCRSEGVPTPAGLAVGSGAECVLLLDGRPGAGPIMHATGGGPGGQQVQMGILRLLEDEGNMPGASDASFVRRVHSTHAQHSCLRAPLISARANATGGGGGGGASRRPSNVAALGAGGAHRRSSVALAQGGGASGAGGPLGNAKAFVVRHFAGDVTYSANGFLEKDSDSLHAEIGALVRGATARLRLPTEGVPAGVPASAAKAAPAAGAADGSGSAGLAASPGAKSGGCGGGGGGGGLAARIARFNSSAAIGANGGADDAASACAASASAGVGGVRRAATGRASIGARFASELDGLLASLGATSVQFVRCVKPNPQQAAGVWESGAVLSQLRTAGMGGVLTLMATGYPSRVPFAELAARFSGLAPAALRALPAVDFVAALLAALGVPESEFALGVTAAFFRGGQLATVESLSKTHDPERDARIGRAMQAWLARRRWRRAARTVVAAGRLAKRLRGIRAARALRRAARLALALALAWRPVAARARAAVRRVRAAVRLQAAQRGRIALSQFRIAVRAVARAQRMARGRAARVERARRALALRGLRSALRRALAVRALHAAARAAVRARRAEAATRLQAAARGMRSRGVATTARAERAAQGALAAAERAAAERTEAAATRLQAAARGALGRAAARAARADAGAARELASQKATEVAAAARLGGAARAWLGARRARRAAAASRLCGGARGMRARRIAGVLRQAREALRLAASAEARAAAAEAERCAMSDAYKVMEQEARSRAAAAEAEREAMSEAFRRAEEAAAERAAAAAAERETLNAAFRAAEAEAAAQARAAEAERAALAEACKIAEAEAQAQARAAEEARLESARSAELLASAMAEVDGLLSTAEEDRNALIRQNEEATQQMAERLSQQQALMEESFRRQQQMERRLMEQQRLLEAKLEEQRALYEQRVAQLETRVSSSEQGTPRAGCAPPDSASIALALARGAGQFSSARRQPPPSPSEGTGRGLNFFGISAADGEGEADADANDADALFGSAARSDRRTPPTRPPSAGANGAGARAKPAQLPAAAGPTPDRRVSAAPPPSAIPQLRASAGAPHGYSSAHARARAAAAPTPQPVSTQRPAPPASAEPPASRLPRSNLPTRRGVSHGGALGSVGATPRASLPARPAAKPAAPNPPARPAAPAARAITGERAVSVAAASARQKPPSPDQPPASSPTSAQRVRAASSTSPRASNPIIERSSTVLVHTASSAVRRFSVSSGGSGDAARRALPGQQHSAAPRAAGQEGSGTPGRPPGYTVDVLARASPPHPPTHSPRAGAEAQSAQLRSGNGRAPAGTGGPSPAPHPQRTAARPLFGSADATDAPPRTAARQPMGEPADEPGSGAAAKLLASGAGSGAGVAMSGLRKPRPVDARSKLSDAQGLLRANKENSAAAAAE